MGPAAVMYYFVEPNPGAASRPGAPWSVTADSPGHGQSQTKGPAGQGHATGFKP